MKQQKFSIIHRIHSFKHAFNGLCKLIKEEHNARIHLLAAFGVVILGFLLKIEVLEWISVIFAIGFVLVAEIINTSIENIADFVSPERNDKIKKIKDLSAAAVLVSAMTALTIGLVIFIPKILAFFSF